MYHLPSQLSGADVEELAAALLDVADALGLDIEAPDHLTSADVADLAGQLANYDLPAVRLAVLDVTAPDRRRLQRARRENFRRRQMGIRQRRRQQRRRRRR